MVWVGVVILLGTRYRMTPRAILDMVITAVIAVHIFMVEIVVGTGAGMQVGIITTIGMEAGMAAEVIGAGIAHIPDTIVVDIADKEEVVILQLPEGDILQDVLRERAIIREEHLLQEEQRQVVGQLFQLVVQAQLRVVHLLEEQA